MNNFRVNNIISGLNNVTYVMQNLNTGRISQYVFFNRRIPNLRLGNIVSQKTLQMMLNQFGGQYVR